MFQSNSNKLSAINTKWRCTFLLPRFSTRTLAHLFTYCGLPNMWYTHLQTHTPSKYKHASIFFAIPKTAINANAYIYIYVCWDSYDTRRLETSILSQISQGEILWCAHEHDREPLSMCQHWIFKRYF